MVIKRVTIKNIIFFQIIFNLFIRFFISMGIPSSIVYLNDFLLLVVFILILCSKNKVGLLFKKIGFGYFITILFIYLLYNIVNSLAHLVNPFHLIWGIRNYFRFFIFFIECFFVLEGKDIEKIFNIFIISQVINFVVSIYQYVELGLIQDRLGGIFGTEIGSNAYTNIFFCIIVSFVLSRYFNKKISLIPVIFILGSTLIIAALAEIKIFYIEFIFILIVIILLERATPRTLIILTISILAVTISLMVLKNILPDHFEVLMNKKDFVDYGNNAYSIDRFHALTQLNNIIFVNNPLSKIIGEGMGSFEYSSFIFLTSNNYLKWGYLHYDWFSHSFIYLEQGIIGLIIYITLVISIIIFAFQKRKLLKVHKFGYLFSFTVSMCFIYIINILYNQSTRIEASYLFFSIICAIPVIIKEIQKNGISFNYYTDF
ncbi:hypothetical protein P7H74_10420 [Enterococcus devriesei]|uniref:hypothetical protein n=1 Tax=Enterococcus devriesei TaxID=319970 RepID=UPI00288F2C89|nr:hypothetical protein [Enterococcus devriesei]MDT2822153.1 hypothetical protein [Enterococcus devriesei]